MSLIRGSQAMEEFKLDVTDKMAHIEESVKSAHKRIDGIEKLTNSVYELASSIKNLQHDIGDMSGRIKAIEEKPGKRWDLIVTTIISTLTGAAVTFIVTLIAGGGI